MPELRQELDETLFHSPRYNPHHVLHRLLPQPKDTIYKFLQRAHNLTLHLDVSSTAKQNFIPRILFAHFADMYWPILPPKSLYMCLLYISCILCFNCNTSVFVICALKNYLLTYLINTARWIYDVIVCSDCSKANDMFIILLHITPQYRHV